MITPHVKEIRSDHVSWMADLDRTDVVAHLSRQRYGGVLSTLLSRRRSERKAERIFGRSGVFATRTIDTLAPATHARSVRQPELSRCTNVALFTRTPEALVREAKMSAIAEFLEGQSDCVFLTIGIVAAIATGLWVART
jgi:hypothetical protein